MEAEPFFRVLIFWMMIVIICPRSSEAQSEPCTLPNNKPGTCVAIQRCRNIYQIIKNPSPQNQVYAPYINKAACTLPGIKRSICCKSGEIDFSTCVPAPTMSKQDLLPSECGNSVIDRISYGNATKVFAYPWMAVLQYNENGAIVDKCGGSLINKRYVLTAAHCIKTRSSFQLHGVVLGEHTKNQADDCNVYDDGQGVEQDCAEPIEKFGIESFKIHQDYNHPRFSNDIGLIRLDRDVTMKDHIKPLCLPVTKQLQIQVNTRYIVTGWGTTENGTESNVLLEANLIHVDNVDCQREMTQNHQSIKLNDKQMCAGGRDDVDACQGDSGGPLGSYSEHNGVRFVQFGIVASGADTCGKKSLPGVYTRLASYMDWILDQIEPSC